MPATSNGFRYPSPSDAPNGPLQMGYLAQDVEDYLGTLTNPPNWAPTLQSSVTTPTMGNTTVAGRRWMTGAHKVDIWAWIRIGTTYSAGDGNLAISLPVPVSATYNRQSLNVTYYDFSGTDYYRGFAHAGESAAIGVTNLNQAKLFYNSNNSVQLPAFTTTAPFVLFTGDLIEVSGSYYID